MTDTAKHPENGAPRAQAPEPLRRDERRARLMIIAGAVVLFSGVALAVTDDDTGRWLILGGIVTLFVALHRFGRLGPEDAQA